MLYESVGWEEGGCVESKTNEDGDWEDSWVGVRS